MLWGILGGTLGFWIRSPWRFSLLGAGGRLRPELCRLFFVFERVVGSFGAPRCSVAGRRGSGDGLYVKPQKKERAVLMQLFSRHVSAEVTNAVWRQREQFMDGGRPRSQKFTATVLFTDLKALYFGI